MSSRSYSFSAWLQSSPLAPLPAAPGAESVTIRGLTFINKGLVGVGRLPASLRDKFGETFGSGSGLAANPKSWTQTSAGYSGVLYMLPDRGYNVSGTIDYMPRINKLSLALTPIADPTGPATTDLQTSITANLDDTILLINSAGAPLTGLDPEEGEIRVAGNGFPDLPQARNSRISIDPESLAHLPDGSFFISDEYGPYILSLFRSRPSDCGNPSACSFHLQAQGQRQFLFQQSWSGRRSARAA